MSTKTFYKHLSEMLVAAMLLALCVAPSAAQNSGSSDADVVVSDFLEVYSFSADKMAQLADAMPANKYDWRPGEGVRSAKEAFLHVTSVNYFFGSQLGAEIPEGINPQTMEQSDMSKEQVISAFDKSVTFIKNAITNMESSTFDEELDLFGSTYTKRQVMYIVGDHAAEHLGQLIAYARMNSVVPPWSQEQ